MNDLESTQQMRDLSRQMEDLSRQMRDLESNASKGVATKILYRWKEDARGNRTMLDPIVAINSPIVIWSPKYKLLYMSVQYWNAADIMLYRFFTGRGLGEKPKRISYEGDKPYQRVGGGICRGPVQIIYELTNEQSIHLEHISEVFPCEIVQHCLARNAMGINGIPREGVLEHD